MDEALGEGGRYGHHMGTGQELVRVPLILFGPGIPAGVQSEAVSLTGLPATLFEYLDLSTFKTHVPSFLPLARDTAAKSDAGPAFVQLWRPVAEGNCGALHTGTTHLSRVARKGNTELQLEDWSSGQPQPLEDEVLAAELADVLNTRQRIDRLFRGQFPTTLGESADNEIEQIRGLGYLGDDAASQ